jgi:hypothetical protein
LFICAYNVWVIPAPAPPLPPWNITFKWQRLKTEFPFPG